MTDGAGTAHPPQGCSIKDAHLTPSVKRCHALRMRWVGGNFELTPAKYEKSSSSHQQKTLLENSECISDPQAEHNCPPPCARTAS
jgi:hypothetical protein